MTKVQRRAIVLTKGEKKYLERAVINRMMTRVSAEQNACIGTEEAQRQLMSAYAEGQRRLLERRAKEEAEEWAKFQAERKKEIEEEKRGRDERRREREERKRKKAEQLHRYLGVEVPRDPSCVIDLT